MTTDYFIDSSEFYYRSYSDRLCGDLTEEKAAYLEMEKERFAALETEQERYLARYNRGEIGQVELDYYLGRLEEDAAPQNSFERAYEQYAALCARKEGGNCGAVSLCHALESAVWPGSCEGTLLLYGIAAGVLILLFSPAVRWSTARAWSS